jgi:hypothetical protein
MLYWSTASMSLVGVPIVGDPAVDVSRDCCESCGDPPVFVEKDVRERPRRGKAARRESILNFRLVGNYACEVDKRLVYGSWFVAGSSGTDLTQPGRGFVLENPRFSLICGGEHVRRFGLRAV